MYGGGGGGIGERIYYNVVSGQPVVSDALRFQCSVYTFDDVDTFLDGPVWPTSIFEKLIFYF